MKERISKQWNLFGLIALPFFVPVLIIALIRNQPETVVYSIETTTSLATIEPVEVPTVAEPESWSYVRQVITDDEFELMARCIQAEAGNQDFDTKLAVAEVIFNRSEIYCMSITDVIYTEGAFTCVDNGMIDTVTPVDSTYEAVQTALETYTYPTNLIAFREDYFHGWAQDYEVIGDLYFSTLN